MRIGGNAMVLFGKPWYPETRRGMFLRGLGEDIFGGIVMLAITIFGLLVIT
jgi:hypothetical protein